MGILSYLITIQYLYRSLKVEDAHGFSGQVGLHVSEGKELLGALGR